MPSTNLDNNTTNNQTGPRTAEGKARSAVNARKHGFTGRTMLVADGQEEEHAEFLETWERDLNPIGAAEGELFAQIINAAWTLRRLSAAEAALLDESLGSPDPLTVDAAQSKLKLYSIYQQRAERSFHKAMAELRKLQEDRLFRDIVLPEDPEGEDTTSVLVRVAAVRRDLARDKRNVAAANWADTKAFIDTPPPSSKPVSKS